MWPCSNACWASSTAPTLSQRLALVSHVRRLYTSPLLADEALPLVARRREALHRQVQRALQMTGESLPDL